MNSHNEELIIKQIEKQKIREKWRNEQRLNKLHEKRKAIMIKEYERKRAEELNENKPKSRYQKSNKTSAIKSEKLDKTIDAKDLHNIKICIHRNIPMTKNQDIDDKLERDILNASDIVVKRNEGEGSKPIFERQEIKAAKERLEEPEERRVIKISKNVPLESPIDSKLSTSITKPSNDRYKENSTKHRDDRMDAIRYKRSRSSSTNTKRNRERSTYNDNSSTSSDASSPHCTRKSSNYIGKLDRSRYRDRSSSPSHIKNRRSHNNASCKRDHLSHKLHDMQVPRYINKCGPVYSSGSLYGSTYGSTYGPTYGPTFNHFYKKMMPLRPPQPIMPCRPALGPMIVPFIDPWRFPSPFIPPYSRGGYRPNKFS